MAPEYLDGQLDLRADLFGVGVIAHELLTGRPLFHAEGDLDSMTLLRELPIEPPSQWNPDVPADLDDIVLTALQRTPERRWQNAAAMRAAITNVMLSLGSPVTNQQLIEWVEWALQQRPPTEALAPARELDAVDEPPCPDTEPPYPDTEASIDVARELGGAPEPVKEPHELAVGAEALPMPLATEGARSSAHGGRRAWLLLLLMLALAVVVRDQLVVTGQQLYAWCTG
jgi:serine/threonine protein kinase